jgi:hypothetical protein
MKHILMIMPVLLCGSACAQTPPSPVTDTPIAAAEWRDPTEAQAGLDGLVVEGRVRARGPMGLVSVPGSLSFEDGQLVWIARETRDHGPYQVRTLPGGTAFRAEHMLENGERAVWTGRYDGTHFHDVSAEWHRVEGDFVHDLLLPETVILDFTPVE